MAAFFVSWIVASLLPLPLFGLAEPWHEAPYDEAATRNRWRSGVGKFHAQN
jgi:hypothetical protein